MDIADLVWSMQFADAWYKNDFAKVLANYNKNMGDELFFRSLLYKGVEVNKLVPINSSIDLSVLPEERNFLFKPDALVQWAILKSWSLPQVFITATSDKNEPLTYRQIIRYLLKRRFPDLELIEASIGDYGQKTDEVNAYVKHLKTHSRTELLTLYDAEQQDEKLLFELRSIQDDELRFFNRPEAQADFAHHCSKKTWTKEEALALTFGKNPKIISMEVLDNYRKNPPLNDPPSESYFIKQFEKIRDILFSDPELGSIEAPRVFLEWFNKNKIPINPSLQKTAIDFGILEAEQFEGIKEIGELNGEEHINKSSEKENPISAEKMSFLDWFPNFPQKLDTTAEVIKVSIETFIKEHKRCPSISETWSHMRRFPPNQYEVLSKSGKNTLVIEGVDLTYDSFRKRLCRYRLNSLEMSLTNVAQS